MNHLSPVIALAAGTYAGGGGRGLYDVSRGPGRWTLGDVYPGAANASFGVYAPRHDLHYLVDEQDRGTIGVHRRGAHGWERLASVPTGGAAPCHAALNGAGTLLAVANYGGGSMSLIRLDEHGLPVGEVQTRANRGSGPNARRQEGPHAHWVGFAPDGRRLYQTDLGTDQVLAFAIGDDGRLGPARIAYAAPPGSGPRHLLLHPAVAGCAYLLSELASTLTVLDPADGGFTARATLSTLPDGWRGKSIAAHIAMNRAHDRLYLSNRGHDSIAVFALDPAGEPTLIQHVPVGGASPRFFLLLEDEGRVIVANEKAQTLTMLAILADGRLAPTGAGIPVPGVAFVMRTGPGRQG